ncbi:MAG: holo-ACP synthase [Oscillospiraceae bacterium]|nr:holo-ACP synthase [Oscillospiraceae bacterium]
MYKLKDMKGLDMRILCGTDIIEVSRIKESIERTGEKFLNIIYTPTEIEYCESKKASKYYHYAGRFAAKEAIFKAVSGLLENKFDISWQNAQVVNDERGNPRVEFLDIDIKKIKDMDISISHCKEYAVATVIVETHSKRQSTSLNELQKILSVFVYASGVFEFICLVSYHFECVWLVGTFNLFDI